ncbi:MAG: S41 family peptidase [Planctomycetota bacterium]
MILGLLLLASTLENPSFEKPGLEAWRLEIGAHLGPAGPESKVEIDPEVARAGKASLRFAGDRGTIRWRTALQSVPVEPGQRVLFRVAARCRDLRREGNQYANANALILFFDQGGRRLGLLTSPVLSGNREWVDLHVHALAPDGSARLDVGVFSSMSGTAWFDDARLEIAPASDLSAAERALRLHLERSYPFWGVKGKPAPDDLPRLEEGRDLTAELRRMLAPLGDTHIWIQGAFGRTPTIMGNPRRPNWNLPAIRAMVKRVELDKPYVLVGRIGEVGYIGLGSFLAEHFGGVEEALDKLEDCKALLIDVRPNGGGDERLAQRLAGRFTDREVTYAKSQVRDPTIAGLHGFRPPSERRFAPLKGRTADRRPVVVLQGPYCVSSTEGFLLMMRALESATTFGLPSRGSSGNPKPFPLVASTFIWIPTWRSLTMDGEPIEGVGAQPEVRFEAPPAAYAEKDPTLLNALERVR